MSRKAAAIIAAEVTLKPDCVLGLATGSTPIGTYQNLVAAYEAGELDFSEVKTYNLDEYRGLPGDHEQSFWPSLRALPGQVSTHWPQATHLASSTSAT